MFVSSNVKLSMDKYSVNTVYLWNCKAVHLDNLRNLCTQNTKRYESICLFFFYLIYLPLHFFLNKFFFSYFIILQAFKIKKILNFVQKTFPVKLNIFDNIKQNGCHKKIMKIKYTCVFFYYYLINIL